MHKIVLWENFLLRKGSISSIFEKIEKIDLTKKNLNVKVIDIIKKINKKSYRVKKEFLKYNKKW